jgi:aryl-alcohol dehydrogenase-like predicted oxidoreductase
MLMSGFATREGTARFTQRFVERLPGHFRDVHGLWLSSIGEGTYLGQPTNACDGQYRESIRLAIEMGTNVIDVAVNYRHQRSERVVGDVLRALSSEGRLSRDEIFLATKGGFLTFDAEEPAIPAAEYFHRQIIQSGLAREQDVAAGCHVMTPAYLRNQIELSCKNLGVETVDLYYLHNPETQLERVSRNEFYRLLRQAFEAFEQAVQAGKIRCYGTATWNAYRVGPDAEGAISLAKVLEAAKEAGGEHHHFRAVQLPFNFAMMEALNQSTQAADSHLEPLLKFAARQNVMVFSSASLLQGQLASDLPPEITRWFANLQTDAQRSLQFVRSTPGITSALVGMSRPEHVKENLGTASVPPVEPSKYWAMFSKN